MDTNNGLEAVVAADNLVAQQLKEAYLNAAKEQGVSVTEAQVEKAVADAMIDYLLDSQGKKYEPGELLSDAELNTLLANTEKHLAKEANTSVIGKLNKSSAVRTVGLAMLGMSATAVFDSCKKIEIEKNEYRVTAPAPSRISVGEVTVVYAPYSSLSSDTKEMLKEYREVIVQPGYISSAQAASTPIRERGYWSAMSLVPGSLSTTALEADLRAYDAAVVARGGSNRERAWLIDEDPASATYGQPMINPATGNGLLYNLRNADIRKLVIDDAKLKEAYDCSSISDENDVGIALNDGKYPSIGSPSYPGFRDGLIAVLNATAKSAGDASLEPLKDKHGNNVLDKDGKPMLYPTKGLKVLSGIQPPGPGAPTGRENDVITAIAEANAVCAMTLEGRTYHKANTPTDPAYRQEVMKRLDVLFAAVKKAGKPYFTLDMLEPATFNQLDGYKEALIETAKFSKQIQDLAEKHGVQLYTNIQIIATNSDGYFDFTNKEHIEQTVEMNLQLKEMIRNGQIPELEAAGVKVVKANTTLPATGEKTELDYELLNGNTARLYAKVVKPETEKGNGFAGKAGSKREAILNEQGKTHAERAVASKAAGGEIGIG